MIRMSSALPALCTFTRESWPEQADTTPFLTQSSMSGSWYSLLFVPFTYILDIFVFPSRPLASSDFGGGSCSFNPRLGSGLFDDPLRCFSAFSCVLCCAEESRTLETRVSSLPLCRLSCTFLAYGISASMFISQLLFHVTSSPTLT